MNKITIICCWNNEKQYKKLLESIAEQSIEVDIIGIDNTKQKFKSCSAAFNSVIDSVNTIFTLFVHQDIVFFNTECIKKIEYYLEKIEFNSVLGLAGSFFDSPLMKTNVIIDANGTVCYGGSKRVNGLLECDTVDECIFGGYTSLFKQRKFDDAVCNGWHFYAVEFCLRIKIDGGKVYVCDVEVIHNSWGSTDDSYNETYRKICKKYKKYYKRLRTPCCYYSGTSFLARNMYYWKKKIGIRLRRLGIVK